MCTHCSFTEHSLCSFVTGLFGFFTSLSVLSFAPAVFRRADADSEDGSGDSGGSAHVLVRHRPSRLVQPRVVLLEREKYIYKLVFKMCSHAYRR